MPRHLPRRAARTSLIASVALGVCVLALTGCTAEPPVVGSPKTPTISDTATAPANVAGDGVLRIGTLFPMTGEAAASGAAQVAGTELAARTVAAEDGIPGRTLELLHRNSAGDVGAAVADLVARGADVVLWDAATTPPDAVAASVTDAGLALVVLGDFAADGTLLAADEEFAARLRTADPGVAESAGGAEAYDGVILTALAATAAGDDSAASLEAGWDMVSAGPTVCTSWGECTAALRDAQRVDYQGITGVQS